MHIFQLFSTIKVKLVDEMMQNNKELSACILSLLVVYIVNSNI